MRYFFIKIAFLIYAIYEDINYLFTTNHMYTTDTIATKLIYTVLDAAHIMDDRNEIFTQLLASMHIDMMKRLLENQVFREKIIEKTGNITETDLTTEAVFQHMATAIQEMDENTVTNIRVQSVESILKDFVERIGKPELAEIAHVSP